MQNNNITSSLLNWKTFLGVGVVSAISYKAYKRNMINNLPIMQNTFKGGKMIYQEFKGDPKQVLAKQNITNQELFQFQYGNYRQVVFVHNFTPFQYWSNWGKQRGCWRGRHSCDNSSQFSSENNELDGKKMREQIEKNVYSKRHNFFRLPSQVGYILDENYPEDKLQEFLKNNKDTYQVAQVQDIESYQTSWGPNWFNRYKFQIPIKGLFKYIGQRDYKTYENANVIGFVKQQNQKEFQIVVPKYGEEGKIPKNSLAEQNQKM